MDKFFQNIKSLDKTKKVIVGYGAAKFKSSGKCEVSVPTSATAKACQRYFKTHFISEYNTTKRCACCKNQLRPVGKNIFSFEKNKYHFQQVRGLLWCRSTMCNHKRSFLDRDFNASINIYKCTLNHLRNKKRPTYLESSTKNKKINCLMIKHYYKLLKQV